MRITRHNQFCYGHLRSTGHSGKLLWQHDFTRFVNLEQKTYDEFEQFSGY